jgi:hypothetical protein
MYQLFKNETTNTQSGAVKTYRARHTVFAWGTWGSATAKLQISPDGATWFDLTGASFTANGTATFEVATDCWLRADISGGTAANLNVAVR